tara:strand:- start:300 stop:806 length:507 start_codon:yes stop_codon:yes gene_type:complete
MILSCNSCEKKFVVPDNAISATGRLVQCSSCGNKWTQFPIGNKTKPNKEISKIKATPKKIKNQTKKRVKKKTGPDLYSPEYLAKKHGIRIDGKTTVKNKPAKDKEKVSFGFYSFLIVSIVFVISILRLLHFAQDIIVEKFPISEIYINYLFESIRNIIEIIQNFLAGY